MPHRKEKKLLTGLAVAFGALAIGALFLLGSASEQRKTAAWVAHTRDALDKITGLVSALSDTENGRRGYVLTGHDRYLVHFTNGVVKAETMLQELRALTLDNPRQSAACNELEGRMHERLNISTNSITACLRHGRDAPEQQDFMQRGQQAMEQIREIAAGIAGEETALLKQRQIWQEKNAKGTEGFAVLVSLFGLALFVTMRHLLNQANQRRQQAEQALQLANLQLEQRVKERTAELSRTVEQLEQAEEFRGKVMESAVFGLGVLDLEGRFTLANSEFGRLMGYEREELLNKPYSILLSPENNEALRAEFLRVIGQKQRIAYREIDVIKKDGSVGNMVFSWSPLIAQGEVKGVVGTVLDMTARKRAEQTLATQLARLDLLSRTTRAIAERQDLPSIFQVVVRNLEDNLPIDFGCVGLYEAVQEELTVVSVGMKSQLVAQELSLTCQARIAIDQNGISRCVHGELVYEHDISQAPFPFAERLARGGLRALVMAPLLVESSVFGVLVAARRQPGSFSSGDCDFLRQLSEHVALAAHQAQLYKALQTAYDDLRRTQQAAMQQERMRALGQMASGIAHDINNAITPVAIYTESLLETEPNLSQRGREYLQTIGRAIDDVAATIGRMREFYRPRQAQLTVQRVQLNGLVEQVVNLTRARWSDMPQQRGVTIVLRTELAPALPTINGVEGEIREALTNLILNAVDAMPGGGSLTVRTRVANGAGDGVVSQRVQVEVVDTGLGMDEDTRRRCLEPFFTTKGERGTGLGLPMVYGVARRHGAELEIVSAVGKGTTMRLEFPASATMPGQAGPGQTASGPPLRLRILAVDDDPMLLKSLRDALELDGHVVVTVNSGQEGIDAFTSVCGTEMAFAVVISDLGMPNVDGRQVAAAIKEVSPDTPIILLTGWGHRLEAAGDMPENVNYVLNKPPKLHEIRHALARCVTAGRS